MEYVEKAHSGDNVRIVVKGEVPENISAGFVLCPIETPIVPANLIEAQLVITDLVPQAPVFSSGYRCVCHIHTAVEECAITVRTSFLSFFTLVFSFFSFSSEIIDYFVICL